MPYYVITVHEQKTGSKLRRKMAIETTDREQAKIIFHEKATSVGFEPDIVTLKEITRRAYEKIVSTLVGKK